MLQDTMKSASDKTAIQVMRNGKVQQWNWGQYYMEAMKFAKSLVKLNVSQRSSVNILGFNSPEWFFSFMGAIMANSIASGIYLTNGPDACHYQADHSEAEVIVVDTNEQLKKFTSQLDKLPRVKAIVVYSEKALPTDF